jgi:hypothetical protein
MAKRNPTDDELKGMTVNERLYACNSLKAFNSAAMKRDKPKMIKILMDVYLPIEEATQTSEAILENPQLYGY